MAAATKRPQGGHMAAGGTRLRRYTHVLLSCPYSYDHLLLPAALRRGAVTAAEPVHLAQEDDGAPDHDERHRDIIVPFVVVGIGELAAGDKRGKGEAD